MRSFNSQLCWSETGDIFILIENGPQLAKQTSEINNKTVSNFFINKITKR